ASEIELLKKFKFEQGELVIHTESSVMPPKRKDWAVLSYMMDRKFTRQQFTVWLNSIEPSLVGKSAVFQTWRPVSEIDPKKVITSVMLTRAVVDANTVALNKELQQRHLEANRKVFFCGSWSCDGLPILESAVTSAKKIAEILGAPIPFQGLKPVVEVAPQLGYYYMQCLQALRQHLPEHKYAIDAAVLGDPAQLPSRNLGYWQAGQQDYAAACRMLADHLAQTVNLNSKDKLLDLGCGQGASLLHWQQHYQVQYLAGVELQAACVSNIQQHLPELNAIYQASFLRLKELPFSQRFDVVLCLDAAYHSPVPLFLEQVRSVLNSNARIGFHHLVLSERWQNLNSFQKRKYQLLLKSADINLKELMSVGALY